MTPAGPATGPPIEVGYSTVRDSSTATGSLGFSGVSTGNMDAHMAALAAYVNKHGGLLGRKIVLVNHDTKTTDSINDPSGSTEAACADWTQDHHVFAAVDTVGLSYGSNQMADCLAKRGVLLISDGDSDGSPASYAKAYGPFTSNVMNNDRYIPALVSRLVAQGFFRGWDTIAGDPGTAPTKIGLMHYDNPGGNRYAAALKKALGTYGMRVDSEVTYANGFQTAVSGGSSAVLKFKSEGITHVFDGNLGFFETAQSQKYYPRMAIDDNANTPATLAQQPGTAKILHGAMGAGFAPALEVPKPQDATASSALCKKIMKDAGQDYSNGYTLVVMLSECGSMFLLMRAIHVGGELSASGFGRGLESFGDSFLPTLTYRARFSATRHDGAAALRDFRYDDACTCFVFPDATLYPA